VQRGHGGARLGLPLRQLEQRPLPLPWKEQLVQVTPARVGGVGIYSGGRM